MNLTEPQAGSDLSAVRTRAVPEGDHYRIQGTKIFITWGEHDMADNIVHLVLARTPDAPEGVKGISLFIVPKFLLKADGTPGETQRHPLRLDRAQDGHPREPDLRARVRRRQGRDRLPRRRGKPRARIHVHDDEPRAARGRRGGRGGRGARLPARARIREDPRAGPRDRTEERRPRHHHPPSRRAPHADEHARADRGDARARLFRGRDARQGEAPSRSRREATQPGRCSIS